MNVFLRRLVLAFAVTIFLSDTVNSECSKQCIHFKGVSFIENMQDDDDYCQVGLHNGKTYYVKAATGERKYLFFDADHKSWKVASDISSDSYEVLAIAHDTAEDPTEISSNWDIGRYTRITINGRFTEKSPAGPINNINIDINCGRYDSAPRTWTIVGAGLGVALGPIICGFCIALCCRRKTQQSAGAPQITETNVRAQPDPLLTLLAACSRDGRRPNTAGTDAGPLACYDNLGGPDTRDANSSRGAAAADSPYPREAVQSGTVAQAPAADSPYHREAVQSGTVAQAPAAVEAGVRVSQRSVDEAARNSNQATQSDGEQGTSGPGASTAGTEYQSALADDNRSAGAGMPLQPLCHRQRSPQTGKQTDEDPPIAAGVSEGICTGLEAFEGDEKLLMA